MPNYNGSSLASFSKLAWKIRRYVVVVGLGAGRLASMQFDLGVGGELRKFDITNYRRSLRPDCQ
ncbi:MAG: hypothetical protein WKG03_02060 [Telluria sp.]